MSAVITDPDANLFSLLQSKVVHSSNSNKVPATTAVATNCSDDAFYNMNFEKRGLALIFNHEKFSMPGVPNRIGSRYDCEALQKILTELEFEVEMYIDKCKSDIEHKLNEVALDVDHSKHDCLLVVVMTHGKHGILTAFDGEYKFEDVWSRFTADQCPTLAGKPKIFITQACRGENCQNAIKMESAEHDAALISYNLPTHADFLFAYSTIEDYSSFRRENDGSWYIQSLCKELELNGQNHDLVTLLTFVSRRVATEYQTYCPKTLKFHGKKQMPCFVSLLTRLVKFTDKKSILQNQ